MKGVSIKRIIVYGILSLLVIILIVRIKDDFTYKETVWVTKNSSFKIYESQDNKHIYEIRKILSDLTWDYDYKRFLNPEFEFWISKFKDERDISCELWLSNNNTSVVFDLKKRVYALINKDYTNRLTNLFRRISENRNKRPIYY